jgi:hypothetical protein
VALPGAPTVADTSASAPGALSSAESRRSRLYAEFVIVAVSVARAPAGTDDGEITTENCDFA